MKKRRFSSVVLFTAGFVILTALQILTMVYFGNVKSGMHEDEYYSYYSTNRTNGFYYPDREWVSSQDILREFVVEEGTGFDFAKVKLSQSWDVHPPLYYYLLHIACSLTPNLFSKWQGLIVNMAAFAMGQILLVCLVLMMCRHLGCSSRSCRSAALWTAGLWGFCPAAISMVMFIRMYSWLTALVLLSAILHVRMAGLMMYEPVHTKAKSILLFIASGLVTLAGFLTHYYFLVYLFFEGIWTLILCLRRKKIKTAFAYTAVQTAALSLAVLYYPACLSHIFRGYRGRQAQEALLDLKSLQERIAFFSSVINRFVFGGILWWLLAATAALLLVAGLTKLYCRENEKRQQEREAIWQHAAYIGMLMAPALGYLLITSKTALLLGDSSVRYVLAVCPILTAMLVMLLHVPSLVTNTVSRTMTRVLAAAAAGVLLLWGALTVRPVIEWPSSGSILFLYTEDAEKIAMARAARSLPTIVAYNDATPYNIWFLTDELAEHPRLFYMNQNNQEPLDDLELAADTQTVLAYIARGDNALSTLHLIEQTLARHGRGRVCAMQYGSEEMWDLYYISSLR